MRGTVGRTAMVVAVVAAALALSATKALAGTPPHLVKDINPGSADSNPFNIVNDGGKALFAAFDPTHGLELHISDGTQAGTHLVLDANPGAGQGAADFFPAKIGTKFVYEGNDGTHGYEPWITDGTSSGTHMIKDIDHGSVGSTPYGFTAWNGKSYFAATDGIAGIRAVRHGRHERRNAPGQEHQSVGAEPGFKSAATPCRGQQAAVQCKRWHSRHGAVENRRYGRRNERSCSRTSTPGANSSYPNGFATLGSDMYFAATDNVHEGELWRTDGTAAGTVRVSNIEPTGHSNASTVVASGGKFFSGLPVVARGRSGIRWNVGRHCWGPGTSNINPVSITSLNGGVVFIGITASDGDESVQRRHRRGRQGDPRHQPWRRRLRHRHHERAIGGHLLLLGPRRDARHRALAYGRDAQRDNVVRGHQPDWVVVASYEAAIGSQVFLTADDGTHGSELMVFTP